MESHKIIQVEEKVPLKLLLPLSIQHMFAMFGASVLVPFIFGINPAIVLFMNGVGTLIFIAVTKAKSPAYLGSSFAFLAPAGVVISKMGYPYALGGFVAVGLCGCILSFIIYKCGTKWIDIVLPPAAMGPVVALIGLELSGSAASNAGLLDDKIDPKNVIVFAVTLGVAVFGNILFRGFLSVIPILIAVIAGYLTALACGILDFTQVVEASWFAIPNFQAPKFDMGAILMFRLLPVQSACLQDSDFFPLPVPKNPVKLILRSLYILDWYFDFSLHFLPVGITAFYPVQPLTNMLPLTAIPALKQSLVPFYQ